jgi:hypothetical protein
MTFAYQMNVVRLRIVAAELIEKKRREGKAPQTIAKLTWLFEKAAPFIGGLPIAGVTSAQVLVALQNVQRAGRHETAMRLRAVVGVLFRVGIDALGERQFCRLRSAARVGDTHNRIPTDGERPLFPVEAVAETPELAACRHNTKLQTIAVA